MNKIITRRGFLKVLGGTSLSALIINLGQDAHATDLCEAQKGFKLYTYDNRSDSKDPVKELTPEDLIGKKAPPFYQLDINLLSQSHKKFIGPQDYGGKIIALNFWATWCTPCHEEFPEFEKVYRANKKDLVVLAMEAPSSVWNLKGRSKSYMDPRLTFETQLTYPILTKEGKAPFDFSVCVIYDPEKIRKKGLKDFWDL